MKLTLITLLFVSSSLSINLHQTYYADGRLCAEDEDEMYPFLLRFVTQTQYTDPILIMPTFSVPCIYSDMFTVNIVVKSQAATTRLDRQKTTFDTLTQSFNDIPVEGFNEFFRVFKQKFSEVVVGASVELTTAQAVVTLIVVPLDVFKFLEMTEQSFVEGQYDYAYDTPQPKTQSRKSTKLSINLSGFGQEMQEELEYFMSIEGNADKIAEQLEKGGGKITFTDRKGKLISLTLTSRVTTTTTKTVHRNSVQYLL